MEVIKSGGNTQNFSIDKIIRAITLANNVVEENERMSEVDIAKVVQNVEKRLEGFNSVSTDDIHDMVESALMKYVKYQPIAKAYIAKRIEKKNRKKYNEIEEQALSLRDGTSILRGDNANKHIDDNASVRDYMAGIKCKPIAEKILPKDIVQAHKKGLIHWHDMDYSPVQKLFNCDLVNADDMLTNTFVMGDTLIEINDETPFRTACNLLAQINLQVSGRQYGGQTISWSHALKYIQNSRNNIRKEIIESWEEDGVEYDNKKLNAKVEKKLRQEIKEGVKTYQYQILCHQSSNGQTPFVSNNLCLREAETEQELNDFAILIEEIFNRRIKGVKDKNGHYSTPLFPKLLYWICDGLNYKKTDPYFYLTELAAKCIASRMQPDIVSEKETRRVKQGQIIPSMGCRSLLSPIWEENIYPIDTKFYWNESAEYPYSIFKEKQTLESIPNGNYESGYGTCRIIKNGNQSISWIRLKQKTDIYHDQKSDNSVNFRGNTGWVISKTDKEVVIKEPKVYGRWNNGVVTINLPHVALEAITTQSDFYTILTDRLELCRKALQLRYKRCCEIQAKNSPILWQFGGLARLKENETVGQLIEMYPQRASISLGYVGLYETCRALIGQSNTTEDGQKLSKEILTFMNQKCDEWKQIDNMNYSIYGTPEESLTYKMATANRRDFGTIEYVTDKDYVVNSYHVDPRENIDAFTKLKIEGEYLALSAGGAVSYCETADLTKNPKAIINIIQWMYNHIVYAEINRILGICYVCGFEGQMKLVKTDDGVFKFICPKCGNTDDDKMNITARLCGYIGQVNAGNTNKGRLDDIYNRVLHLDCYDDNAIQEIMKEIYDIENEVQ